MPEEDSTRATVVDLASLSVNFPPLPLCELQRDNVVSTIQELFENGARAVIVEGQEGMGKTTLLSQFVRRYPTHAISVFVSAANRLSFDPDLVLQDLLTQVNWSVTKEVLKPASADLSELKSSYLALQRKAKQKKTVYYFVFDGTEELDEPQRELLVQHLIDLLPVGVPQFRSLFSGKAQIYRALFPRYFPVQSYPLSLLSIGESKAMLPGKEISDDQMADVHGLCRGIPGRVASVWRVLQTGVSLTSYLENAPSKFPEFFEAEWRQIPDSDNRLKEILALLAHDSKPHTIATVAETLHLDAGEADRSIRGLNFLTVDAENNTIHFAAESMRKYIADRLAYLKPYVLKVLIEKLLASPESNESILELPGYLEEAAQFLDVLNLLTPDHILEVLKRSESLGNVDEAVQRGLRAARRLDKDHELLRFGIQSAVIAEFASSAIWASEVGALVALGRDDEAMALANNAILWEDRLQFLSALAVGIWRRGDNVSDELIDQIKSLIERTDTRSLKRRAHDIAAQLVCIRPDLASKVLEKVKGGAFEENDLDRAFFHVSLQAVTSEKDEKRREELLQNISLISPEPEFRSLFNGLRTLSGRLGAQEVRTTVDGIGEVAGKLAILRAWCVLNAEHTEAGQIAQYSLDTALQSTGYTIDASVLADLSSPIRDDPDSEQRQQLISAFDALSLTAARLGPSIKYVEFQLNLAAAEAVDRISACEARLGRVFDYITHIEDLPSKAEAFGSFLGGVEVLDAPDGNTAKSKFEKSCIDEIETIVLRLTEATADHYLAFKGLTCALSTRYLDKALEYTRLVNMQARRDRILADVVGKLVHRTAAEIDPYQLRRTIDHIDGRYWKDRALQAVMERFENATSVSESVVNDLIPIIHDLVSIDDSVIACRALVRAFNLLIRHPSSTRDETSALLWNQITERWSNIDVGWVRIDVGFGLANDLAGTCTEYAAMVLKETEELKEKWQVSAYEPASAYVSCIRLVIRAFRGLLPRKLDTATDIKRMVSLIDVLPSYGERAILWADLCMRCSLANRQDLCQMIVAKYLGPILDKIPAQDAAYRASVLISAAPALYLVHPASCLDTLQTLSREHRDLAIRAIIQFNLHKRVPSDAKDSSPDIHSTVSYDTLIEVVNLLKHIGTDWMIEVVAEDIADLLDSEKNKNSLNNPQRESIAAQIEGIAETNLPMKGQIEHPGWQIMTIARALHIRRAKDKEWEFLIARADALSNVADQAYVLNAIALCLPARMGAQRSALLQRAMELVGQIPSITDKIDRYVGFAEDLADIDKTRCRSLLAAASDVFPRTVDELRDEHNQLVDIAFRIDESFAAGLIDRLDDDSAKKAAQAQLSLLKVRREVFDDIAAAHTVDKINPRDLAKLGWMFVRALGGRRLQTFPPSEIRDYLDAAAEQPLRRAYSTLIWYVENAVERFSETDHAIAFLRPMFDSCVVGAQLAGQVAGKSLTRLRGIKDRAAELSLGHAKIITPRSREQAIGIISDWLERNLGDFVKITDPYFGPSDLEWLQIIRSAKSITRITIMTSRQKQPRLNHGEELEERYVAEWKRRFDQKPPRTEIAVIGGERTLQSPIHDRWIITDSAGLRIGTSLNSLGIDKDSDISELSPEESEDRLAQIDQYLNGEIMEFKGERLRLSTFRLIV